jgi:hypothetical protein
VIVTTCAVPPDRPARPPGSSPVAALDVEWSKNYKVTGGDVPFCYPVVWLAVPDCGEPADLAVARFSCTSAYVETPAETRDLIARGDCDLSRVLGHASLIAGHQLCSDLAVLARAVGRDRRQQRTREDYRAQPAALAVDRPGRRLRRWRRALASRPERQPDARGRPGGRVRLDRRSRLHCAAGSAMMRDCTVLAVEGTHASGKTTLTHALAAHYREQGIHVATVEEPARHSPFIEEIVVHGQGWFDLETEADLFGAQLSAQLSLAGR